MNEVKKTEVNEVKVPEKSFKDIKPETSMTADQAKEFIKNEIVHNKEKNEGSANEGKDSNEAKETGDVEEKTKKGGSYRDVKKTSDGEKEEVHHMPADCVSPLDRNDGPAIKMDKDDHRETASCGNSREAKEYQEKQKELIDQGKFREAVQMDIDDIREKFGDKYDDAISEMLDYVDQLEEEGKI